MDLGTDHAEVEMLLESYSKQVEEIVNEVDSLAVRWSTLFQFMADSVFSIRSPMLRKRKKSLS